VFWVQIDSSSMLLMGTQKLFQIEQHPDSKPKSGLLQNFKHHLAAHGVTSKL
jgi:hypothetical protein